MHRSVESDLARTPAAATSSIPASSLHPSYSHLLHWMRESLGFARVVSSVDLVAEGRFLSRAAVSGLAGVEPPVS